MQQRVSPYGCFLSEICLNRSVILDWAPQIRRCRGIIDPCRLRNKSAKNFAKFLKNFAQEFAVDELCLSMKDKAGFAVGLKMNGLLNTSAHTLPYCVCLAKLWCSMQVVWPSSQISSAERTLRTERTIFRESPSRTS